MELFFYTLFFGLVSMALGAGLTAVVLTSNRKRGSLPGSRIPWSRLVSASHLRPVKSMFGKR